MSNVPREKGSPDRVAFTHQSAFNEIVQPGRFVSLTHYFIANWLPKISPNGLKILTTLRSMGFYNSKSGEARGEVDIEQDELAALIEISAKTIQRAFADDQVLNKYVRRVFSVQRDRFGRIVKEHYVYVVTMDDVLTPADQARYERLIEGPDKGPGCPKGQSVASADDPKRHFDASDGHCVPPNGHNDASERQSVSPYKESLTLPTENTALTPAAGPEYSLSLFSGEEKEALPATVALETVTLAAPELPARRQPRPWPQLADAEREPHFVQARRELEAIHAGTGISPKAKLIEVRARNLYEVEGKTVR